MQQYFSNALHRLHLQTQGARRADDDLAMAHSLRPLHKDAVRTFRAVQQLMGDSEKGATSAPNTPRLEDIRWLLGIGLSYSELRNEVYC